ncbi:MAG: hypothetical protein BWZ03_00165 [bacterium ADurb.BinA186]|nr:MAG: hypothetical protein BWZ03_00165 [bacterium ADurb.BinA186]
MKINRVRAISHAQKCLLALGDFLKNAIRVVAQIISERLSHSEKIVKKCAIFT